MKGLVVALSLLAVVGAVSFFDLVKEEWNAYKLEHGKKYDSEIEDKFRMKIYAENKHRIAKHNQRYQQGLVGFKLQQNKYGDLLHHEFVHIMNGFNKTSKHSKGLYGKGRDMRGATFIPPAHSKAPEQVDWRKQGAVTDVKDQGKCGSCWSFSTLSLGVRARYPPRVLTCCSSHSMFAYAGKNSRRDGAPWAPLGAQGAPSLLLFFPAYANIEWDEQQTGALEGQHFRKSGYLVSLSEQNLIDCSSAYGNNGCNGGLMDNAFKYIRDNHGLDTEKSYPYEAVDDKCRYNPKNNGADDVGFVDILAGDEDKLMAAVASVGPVSVAIDASQESFQFYSSGVYYDENCSTSNLDHGVLVVGYGTDEQGGDYWLVKNSWGRTWGELGYIKMARNRDNHCGIASAASYPLV